MTECDPKDVLTLPVRNRVWPRLLDLGAFLAIGIVLVVKLWKFWISNPLYALGFYVWWSSLLTSLKAMKPMAERPGFLDFLGPLLHVRPRGAGWPRWFNRLLDVDLAPTLLPVAEAYLEWDGPYLLLRDRRLPTPAITLGTGKSAVPVRDWLKDRGLPIEGIDPFSA